METLGHRDTFSGPSPDLECAMILSETNDLADSEDSVCRGQSKPSFDDGLGSFGPLSIRHSKDESGSSERKLQQIIHKTEAATKRLLKQDRQEDLPDNDDQSRQMLHEDAAFNLDRLDTEHQSGKGTVAKLQVNLHTVVKGIKHPKQGIKSKATRSAAGRLSRVERPYLSKAMDTELLEAHDHLSRAQFIASSADKISKEDPDPWGDGCKERVEQLEARRESLRAAYTTSRLVRRVRVVPKRHINFPGEDYFIVKDDQGNVATYDWLKWIGYNVLFYTQDFAAQYIDDFDELPFDIDSVRQQVERLAMASAPWQAEWSFQYLRKNAQATREQLVRQKVDRVDQEQKSYRSRVQVVPGIIGDENSSDEDNIWQSASSTAGILDESDIIAYRACSRGVFGRLILYSGGVRFVRSAKRREIWRRSFLELAEMRKKEGSSASRIPGVSSQSLELIFTDDCKIVLEGIKDRDSAFNTIIGFSGLQWQSLQAKTV
ncbi:MAG: hypothetical protein Q9170_003224 [Blastenia crenularia]